MTGILTPNAVYNTLLSLFLAWIVLLFATMNWIMAFLAIFNVSMIVLIIFGLLTLFGWVRVDTTVNAASRLYKP